MVRGKDVTGFSDVWNQVLKHPLHVSITFPDHFLHKVGDLAVGKLPALTVLQTETKGQQLEKSPREAL